MMKLCVMIELWVGLEAGTSSCDLLLQPVFHEVEIRTQQHQAPACRSFSNAYLSLQRSSMQTLAPLHKVHNCKRPCSSSQSGTRMQMLF